MFSRAIVVASAMAAALAFMPTTASAKTNVDVNVNIGAGHGWCYYRPYACGYGYDPGYGYGHYPRRFYYPPRYEKYRTSCGEAKQIVRDRGFYKVRAQSCGRHIDSFTGWKGGRRWLIEVGTQRGNVRVVRW